jgi:hypothetical protein
MRRVPHFSRVLCARKPALSLSKGGDFHFESYWRRVGPTLSGFPQARVTSNLDLEIQQADHRQGGGGMHKAGRNRRNPFVLKILTCKPLSLNILQGNSANPAPVKPFTGGGGGGYPQIVVFPKANSSEPADESFLERYPQPKLSRLILPSRCLIPSEESRTLLTNASTIATPEPSYCRESFAGR